MAKTPAPVVTPVAVSQWTAPAIAGLKSGAKYLQLVRDWRIPHTRIGQDVIVELPVLRNRSAGDVSPWRMAAAILGA